ncbi:MucR family transcriptional regulator [Caulobacter sp. KR2-114]|uniref:MucR family transcriptional regulator n=1 Tax=Caulobacter sp. KR2-114 TaxID=3400912 RepID=UPI003C0DE2FD
MADSERLQELVAEVAAAYFSNSHVTPAEIPTVVQQIASSLAAVKAVPEAGPEDGAVEAEAPAAAKRMPVGQVRKSITAEALVSFEDGRPYKTLRRHLATRGLTPEQYREKWGLPADYPMVSANYSAARSAMAKSLGLGQKGRGGAPAAPKASRSSRRKST